MSIKGELSTQDLFNTTATNNTCNSKQEDITEAHVSGEILLMMLLLSLSLGGSHYLRKFKRKILSEPMLATIIGLLAGSFLTLMKNDKYINNITGAYVKFFLILLLPMIIFESAYNMKRKAFFRNLGTILLYAFLGTLISILVTGLSMWGFSSTGLFPVLSLRESLAYGSFISATDPVAIITAFRDYNIDPDFFQIVLGESILNDAVSIVFYETSLKYGQSSLAEQIFLAFLSFLLNIIGSTILGYAIGYLTAIFLKFMSSKVKQIEKFEISLMVILPWVSYLTAQVFGLSGIVSILFNGIAHATYTKPNLTEWSKITVKTCYESVANLFETLTFIFLGIGYFSFQHPYDKLSIPFVIISILIILFSRFVNIFLCTKLANMSRTESQLDFKKQFFLWFSGVRGAMALALAIKSKFDFPEAGPIFLVLTLIIISFTLVYSTLFLETTLKRCAIMRECQNESFSDAALKKQNCFTNFKVKIDEWNQRYLIPCVIRECNYDSESPQIRQHNGLQALNQINPENMKINERNVEDKADKLVIRKSDYQLDNRNVEVQNDSIIH